MLAANAAAAAAAAGEDDDIVVVDFSDVLEGTDAVQGAIDSFVSLSDQDGGVGISSQSHDYGVNANLSDSGSVDIDQLIISQQQQQDVA